MKALFLASQDNLTRKWFPVGKLTKDSEGYHFSYTKGALEIPEFRPFGLMKDLNRNYFSKDLFPLFANRVLPKNRPEYSDYMQWLGLASNSDSDLDQLARSGGLRATDSLELIPCSQPTSDRRYESFFFCRGISHFPNEIQARINGLVVGEQLFVLKDIQNNNDPLALMLRTNVPISTIGYAPGFFSREFNSLILLCGQAAVTVTVEKVNRDAPPQYRLLCRLSAPWLDGFDTCQDDVFCPLSNVSVNS